MILNIEEKIHLFIKVINSHIQTNSCVLFSPLYTYYPEEYYEDDYYEKKSSGQQMTWQHFNYSLIKKKINVDKKIIYEQKIN